MAYCYQCGVALELPLTRCPLCGTDVPSALRREEASPVVPAVEGLKKIEENLEEPGQKQKTALAAVLVTVLFLIPALILMAVARVREESFGWALYPLFSLALSWAAVVLMMVFFRSPRLLAAIYAVLIPAALYLLDRADGSVRWFWDLGVPVLAAFYSVVFLAIFLVWKVLKNLFYRAAAALFLAGLFLVVLEAIINYRLFGVWRLGWSLICSSALFPTGGFLIILSILVRSSPELRKIFRL